MQSHYFDYNSTTPVLPSILKAIEPFWGTQYANPSSLHHMGRQPYKAIREARRQVMRLAGAHDEDEIVFTSGGSESNTTAIRAALQLNPQRKEIVTTAVEHSSLKNLFERLEKQEGYQIHTIGVDANGQLDLNAFEQALSDQVAVASVMMVNNETGIVFPISKIAKIVKEKKILFHVDAIQAIGRLPLCVEKDNIDFLSISGHKFYAPKGIGALYARRTHKWDSLIVGGSQERSRRGGTENVPAIVGLGAASQLVHETMKEEVARIEKLTQFFEQEIEKEISDIVIHGKNAERVVGTSNVRFENIKAETLLMALDHKGICVSRGSACMSGAEEVSYVLKAMGLSDDQANSSMRFSFGRKTTHEDVQLLVNELSETVEELRKYESENVSVS